jgi:hypothetical protein
VHVDMGDPINITHISQLKGYGVFAKRNISAGECLQIQWPTDTRKHCCLTRGRVQGKEVTVNHGQCGHGPYLDGTKKEKRRRKWYLASGQLLGIIRTDLVFCFFALFMFADCPLDMVCTYTRASKRQP